MFPLHECEGETVHRIILHNIVQHSRSQRHVPSKQPASSSHLSPLHGLNTIITPSVWICMRGHLTILHIQVSPHIHSILTLSISILLISTPLALSIFLTPSLSLSLSHSLSLFTSHTAASCSLAVILYYSRENALMSVVFIFISGPRINASYLAAVVVKRLLYNGD